jgi:hypothetical protein
MVLVVVGVMHLAVQRAMDLDGGERVLPEPGVHVLNP